MDNQNRPKVITTGKSQEQKKKEFIKFDRIANTITLQSKSGTPITLYLSTLHNNKSAELFTEIMNSLYEVNMQLGKMLAERDEEKRQLTRQLAEVEKMYMTRIGQIILSEGSRWGEDGVDRLITIPDSVLVKSLEGYSLLIEKREDICATEIWLTKKTQRQLEEEGYMTLKEDELNIKEIKKTNESNRANTTNEENPEPRRDETESTDREEGSNT